jgi:uncharacterized protein (DUF58 family)
VSHMELTENAMAAIGISLFILIMGVITGGLVFYVAAVASFMFIAYDLYSLYSARRDLRQHLTIKRGLSKNEVLLGTTTLLVCKLIYNGKSTRTMLVTQPLDDVLQGNGHWKPVKLHNGSTVFFRTTLGPRKCGRYTISPPDVTIGSRLFKDTFTVGKDLQLAVYLSIGQSRRRVGPYGFRGNFEASIFDATEIKKGKGPDFLSIRRYVDGDSLKSIDWVHSSRSNNLMVKEYEDEKPVPALFIIDVDPSMGLGGEESGLAAAISLVAAIMNKILVNDERVGAACFSHSGTIRYIQASMGAEHIYNLRAMLSTLEPAKDEGHVNRHDQETLPFDLRHALGKEPGLGSLVDDMLNSYMANIKLDGFSRTITSVLKTLNTESSIIIITNLSMGMTSLLNGIRITRYYGHQVSVVLLPHVWHEDEELVEVEMNGALATLRAHRINAVIMYPGESPEDVIRSSGVISFKTVAGG